MPVHANALLKAWYYPAKDENTAYLSAPLLSVNPYTAQIVADREFYHATVVGWIYKLHITLLLGKAGEWLVGLLGLGLAASVVSGIWQAKRHLPILDGAPSPSLGLALQGIEAGRGLQPIRANLRRNPLNYYGVSRQVN